MSNDRDKPADAGTTQPMHRTVSLHGSFEPPPAIETRFVLLVSHRDGMEVVPLAPDRPVVVGRSAPADVVIDDEGLSRRHARFSLTRGLLHVDDLGSTNGMQIGGKLVAHAMLMPGEAVMLGGVTVMAASLSGDEAVPVGVASHEAFMVAAQAEIARARFFGRPLSVLVVRAETLEKTGWSKWYIRVQRLLRPFDQVGFHGDGVVEILRPEATQEQALELGRAIVAAREDEPRLMCGVAVFPEAGLSAEALVSAAREAARSARSEEPLRTAANVPLSMVLPSVTADADDIVLQSPAMKQVAWTARRVARARLPVLLRGETGSGKDVLAQLIHSSGPRRDKPFVCVNCAAIPPSLIESTLFGHEKGAFFAGGGTARKGVFEEADGGTLLLDEIGELSPSAQAALLRVIETQRVNRVGSVREIPVNVRVIATTHRDLEAMSQTGAFRQDLLFRLSAVEVSIPPLREHREDIAPLAAHFLAREVKAADRGAMTIDAKALALMERYGWPGNVRELRNVIERAVAIADGDAILPRDLPGRIRGLIEPVTLGSARPESIIGTPAYMAPEHTPPPASAASARLQTGTLKERMVAFEREALLSALRDTGGKQTEAARLLDIPLRTLQHKIRTYRIGEGFSGDPEQSAPRGPASPSGGVLPSLAMAPRPRTREKVPALGDVLGDQFRLLGHLRAGGMSNTFLAENLFTGRSCVVKPQRASAERDARDFLQEPRILIRLPTDHVPEVLRISAGEDGYAPWFATSFVEGSTVTEWLSQVPGGSLDPVSAFTVLAHICEALSAAHRRGIVHCNLKPDNVLVGVGANSPTATLFGFGTATWIRDRQALRNLDLVGTPGYMALEQKDRRAGSVGTPICMAPEQLLGFESVSPATDVWALGLLAFYLLTGRYYWLSANGGSLRHVLIEVMQPRVESASRRAARLDSRVSLPEGFDDWFARCVAPFPNDRFATAGEAFQALGLLSTAERSCWSIKLSSHPATPADSVVERLRTLCRDSTLTLRRIERGSVVLVLEGSQDSYRAIMALLQAGQLKELHGAPVAGVEWRGSPSESMQPRSASSANAFIAYAPKDSDLCDELLIHLSMMRRQGVLREWYDRRIAPGEDVGARVKEQLEQCHVFIPLVTADFLASDYCFQTEMGRALERHGQNEAVVVPTIVRACDWKHPPLGNLQVLPRTEKPVTSWPNRDEAWLEVVRGIREVVSSLPAP